MDLIPQKYFPEICSNPVPHGRNLANFDYVWFLRDSLSQDTRETLKPENGFYTKIGDLG